jgi:hypothetical protein
MNADHFWKIIEEAKDRADDGEEQVELVYERLKTLSPDEIVGFDQLYDEFHARAYRWDLWGAAYLMNGGCSDDGFEYFRGWLISRGRAVYEQVLGDPDRLAGEFSPDRDDYELESLLYAAARAYEVATGQEMPARERVLPELVGQQWNEDDLDEMFPALSARIGAADGETGSALETLMNTARSGPTKSERVAAIYSLGRMGAEAGEAIPLLNELLTDSDEQVRTMAGRALRQIAGT